MESNDSDDLQALFDSIATQRPPAAAPEIAEPSPEGHAEGSPADRMLQGIGELSRTLHDSLRELGYDRAIEEAASAIPDARDRLAYVAAMTEQAAQRVLTATELAKPIQDQMAADASQLSTRWNQLLAGEVDIAGFRSLVEDTRGYLDNVPPRVSATNMQLLEIVMAQDFQDLTGQVIKKITELAQKLESQLLQLLVQNTPPERRSKEANSLLNGPVINAAGRTDVVASQQQVDDLLESLGF